MGLAIAIFPKRALAIASTTPAVSFLCSASRLSSPRATPRFGNDVGDDGQLLWADRCAVPVGPPG